AVGSAYSPDGKWLAVACGDQSVRVYDRKTGRLARRLTGHTQGVWCVAFSSDSKTLASGSGRFEVKTEPGELKLWDATTWHEKFALDGVHNSIVTGMAFTPDGKTLASCAWDGTVCLWDAEQGRKRAALAGFAKGAIARGLCMSKDGKAVAVSGFDGTVRLWNTQTAKEIATLKTPEAVAHSVSFSPDGKTVAVACNPIGSAEQPLWSGKGSGLVVLLDVEKKEEVRRLEWKSGKVLAVAYSPDGQTIATGGVLGADGAAVRLWDPETGKQNTAPPGARPVRGPPGLSPQGP